MNSQKGTKDNKKKTQGNKAKGQTLEDLIKGDRNFQLIDNGKLKCLLTGHEMIASIENYQAYLQSKSYKRGLESRFDLSEYEGILVEHKNNPHFLFCQLTGAKVPKKKTAIEKHVNGKKFQKRFAECNFVFMQLKSNKKNLKNKWDKLMKKNKKMKLI